MNTNLTKFQTLHSMEITLVIKKNKLKKSSNSFLFICHTKKICLLFYIQYTPFIEI